MRVWTLIPDADLCRVFVEGEAPSEAVRVIELEPVLDLLTRFYTGSSREEAIAERALEALLKAHGRLRDAA